VLLMSVATCGHAIVFTITNTTEWILSNLNPLRSVVLMVFWSVTPCSVVDMGRHFSKTCCGYVRGGKVGTNLLHPY
jgi:hypothetical protein